MFNQRKRGNPRRSDPRQGQNASNRINNRTSYSSIQARGFGNNKDNVIWDSGDVIKWIEAKDTFINKFKSKNVYHRIFHDGPFDMDHPPAEETFDEVLPSAAEYVGQRLGVLRAENDSMLGRKKSALQELVDRGAMTDNVRFTKVYDADIAHETRSNYIETSEKYRFENEYRRERQEFVSRKLKFDEDTAKVIEIFNEYLGSSARSLITEDLNANRFKSAWKRLDNYYNTTEAVDVTGLMSYLTTVRFDPDRDGTLEKFIGKLTHVFTQLATVNNALSEETKLGFVRGALEKGSNRYDSTLTMCKFSRANLTDTLKHLHDFEQERSIKIFAGNSRGEKRKHVLEQMNVSTTSNKNNNKIIIIRSHRTILEL